MANSEKQDSLPGDWVVAAFPNEARHKTFLDDNDLDGLPLDPSGFLTFFEKRKARVRDRLYKALGTTAP
jgi:hypothetical protein